MTEMTTAERVAEALGRDGQVFETADGISLEELAKLHGAGIEVYVVEIDDLNRAVTSTKKGPGAMTTDDSKVYRFDDGSALVEFYGAWWFEGDLPGSWKE